MDRHLFRTQVAQLLTQVGISAKVIGSNVTLDGGVYFVIDRYNSSSVMLSADGSTYRRTGASQCAARIVELLPGAIDERKRALEYERKMRFLRILGVGGPRVGNIVTVAPGVKIHANRYNDKYGVTLETKDLVTFQRALDLLLIVSKKGFNWDNGESLLRQFLQNEVDYTNLNAYADFIEEIGETERAGVIRELINEQINDVD